MGPEANNGVSYRHLASNPRLFRTFLVFRAISLDMPFLSAFIARRWARRRLGRATHAFPRLFACPRPSACVLSHASDLPFRQKLFLTLGCRKCLRTARNRTIFSQDSTSNRCPQAIQKYPRPLLFSRHLRDVFFEFLDVASKLPSRLALLLLSSFESKACVTHAILRVSDRVPQKARKCFPRGWCRCSTRPFLKRKISQVGRGGRDSPACVVLVDSVEKDFATLLKVTEFFKGRTLKYRRRLRLACCGRWWRWRVPCGRRASRRRYACS